MRLLKFSQSILWNLKTSNLMKKFLLLIWNSSSSIRLNSKWVNWKLLKCATWKTVPYDRFSIFITCLALLVHYSQKLILNLVLWKIEGANGPIEVNLEFSFSFSGFSFSCLDPNIFSGFKPEIHFIFAESCRKTKTIAEK